MRLERARALARSIMARLDGALPEDARALLVDLQVELAALDMHTVQKGLTIAAAERGGVPIVTSPAHEFNDLLGRILGDVDALLTESAPDRQGALERIRRAALEGVATVRRLQAATLEASAPRRPSPSEVTAAESREAPLRVLAVDDEESLLDLLVRMLRLDGHEVSACTSAEEALIELSKQRFDLVLSDVGMPGLNGLELVERLAESHPRLPVALVTGWGAQIDLSEAVPNGAFAVISKPYSTADLRRLISVVRKQLHPRDATDATKAGFLIVDSNAGQAALLSAMLRPLGHDVIETHSGSEALARLNERESSASRIAVVLVDAALYDMDCWRFAAAVRALPPPRTVILLASAPPAMTDDAVAERGIAKVLLKPFTLTDLRTAAEGALERAGR